MTATCPPPDDDDALAFAATDPCTLFAELKRAYLAVITGNGRQRLRINDRDSWFQKSDAPLLRAEMDRAAAACRAADPRLAAQLGADRPRAAGFRLRPFAFANRPYKL